MIKNYNELLQAHSNLKIEITSESVKFLEKMNSAHRLQIYKKLDYIFKDTEILIPLKHNLKDLYKYRVGDTRIIFDKVSTTHIIIYLVGNRKDIYKMLERMRM